MNINRIKANITENQQGCWEWGKSCNSAGYGQLTEDGVYWLTHRYAYECIHKNLQPTDVVRHMCHNTRCCNPDHLMIGTHKDNWHDSEALHLESAKIRRAAWIVNGVQYPTIRIASQATKLTMHALNKYTENGVFNITAYRAGCKKANKTPKL